MNETERIIALSNAFGPSGFEDRVAEIVKDELRDIGTLERDSLMNHRMILNPESTGPKVMLDAHMDEVGVIVQAVKPNGTMKFLTLGGWLNVLSLLQITVQVSLLRKKCNPVEIVIQTVLAFAYGYMTDFSCWLIKGIEVESYVQQIMIMMLGCIILAFGIWLQLKGAVAMLPGEAMNRTISMVTGKKYENVKIFFDMFYIAVAAVICLAFLGRLEGVREGSIFAAVAVGNIIKVYNSVYNKLGEKRSKI